MLANSLFTHAQQKVLGLLFVRVDEEFHFNEILRLTGLGSASLQRDLARLSEAGLLQSRRVGNVRLFVPNKNSPVYAELHGLVQKTLGIPALLRKALEPLKSPQGLAFIYGSTADGSSTASSDVDLMLVDMPVSYTVLMSALEPVSMAIGRAINPTLYSLDEFLKRQREEQHFLLRVMEAPKIFMVGSGDELDRLGQPGQDSQIESGAIESA